MSNIRLISLITVTVCLTSCNFFIKKLSDQIITASKVQNKAADSLRESMLNSKMLYEQDPVFEARMDTVYACGFRLADLADSMQKYPGDETYIENYKDELIFFRNYINHHFYYSDVINSGLTTIGIGVKMRANPKTSQGVPGAMGTVFSSLVKPNIMKVILSCRAQYLNVDTIAHGS